MPEIYLKDGGTVEVSLEEAGEFLRKNQDITTTRKIVLHRKPIHNLTACPSSK